MYSKESREFEITHPPPFPPKFAISAVLSVAFSPIQNANPFFKSHRIRVDTEMIRADAQQLFPPALVYNPPADRVEPDNRGGRGRRTKVLPHSLVLEVTNTIEYFGYNSFFLLVDFLNFFGLVSSLMLNFWHTNIPFKCWTGGWSAVAFRRAAATPSPASFRAFGRLPSCRTRCPMENAGQFFSF